MASSKTFVTQFRRKRERKTNYKKRFALVKADKEIILARKMLNSVQVQIIKYNAKGDITLVYSNTNELRKNFGWKGHGGNSSSSYLVGYLAGLKAKKNNIKEGIFSIGNHEKVKKSALFAVLKGVIDAGIKIKHSEDILPDENKISGKITEEHAKKLKSENPEQYKKMYGGYKKRGIEIENISKHFNEVKNKIKEKWQ